MLKVDYFAGVNVQDTVPNPQVTTPLELGFATIDLTKHRFDEGIIVLYLLVCRVWANQETLSFILK